MFFCFLTIPEMLVSYYVFTFIEIDVITKHDICIHNVLRFAIFAGFNGHFSIEYIII